MRLPAQQAAAVAAAHADAAALLAALRVPGLLGAAAGSAAALQWRGQLAAAVEGEHNAEGVPVAPPRLAVQPACIAVPPPGQPWPLVELRLQGSQAAGWDLARATVLARQSGEWRRGLGQQRADGGLGGEGGHAFHSHCRAGPSALLAHESISRPCCPPPACLSRPPPGGDHVGHRQQWSAGGAAGCTGVPAALPAARPPLCHARGKPPRRRQLARCGAPPPWRLQRGRRCRLCF